MRKIKSPLDVRFGVQRYMSLDQPSEVDESVKQAVIYKALEQSVSSALGFYDGQHHDYSKNARDAVGHVRRLVLGWLILPGAAVFGPLSSVDERVTPQAVNGLSRWISVMQGHHYIRRPMFFDQLMQVIYCAQRDYKKTQAAMIAGESILFSECLEAWQEKLSQFEFTSENVARFQMQNLRAGVDQGNGPKLLAQHAAVYAAHLVAGEVESPDDVRVIAGSLDPELPENELEPDREILEPELSTDGWGLSDYFD